MSHTPTPWFYDAGDSGDASVGMQAVPPSIYSGDGSDNVYPICTLEDPVCRVDRKPVDEYDECLEWSGSSDENGDFIVMACNTHDELVAALHALLAHGERSPVHAWSSESKAAPVVIARALLAKVTR